MGLQVQGGGCRVLRILQRGTGVLRWRSGGSLIEVLLGILIVVLASIGTLSYFAYAFGSVNKQGNHRAALERARERLEELLEVDVAQIQPPAD